MMNSDEKAWQLLDKITLASVAEQRKTRRWGIFFKLLTFIYIAVIISMLPGLKKPEVGTAAKSHVGMVRVEGIIAADGGISANQVVSGLREAFKSDKLSALILAINSPGGSPVQSSYIYQEIERLRGLHPDKKVYAVVSDIAASGGYYIAAAADEIYADRSSLLGSIGVISESFGFSEAMNKLGIERRLFTAGESKAFLDPYSPLSEKSAESWQKVLVATHDLFKERVRNGRGARLQENDEVFSGLVWSAERAMELGLIDGIGSAGYVARDIVGVEDIVDYTVRANPLDDLISKFGISVGEGAARVLGESMLPVVAYPSLR